MGTPPVSYLHPSTLIPLSPIPTLLMIEEEGPPVFAVSEKEFKEESINNARDEIYGELFALVEELESFSVLEMQLAPVISYKPTYSYLYADAEGNLSYAKTSGWFNEKKVVAAIRSLVTKLNDFFNSNNKDNWKAVRLASKMVEGLNTIIDDYASYPTFVASLMAIREECEEFFFELALIDPLSLPTLPHLFTTRFESCQMKPFLDRIEQDYGERLAIFIKKFCISDRNAPTIKRETIQGCLMALASNVKKEDLTKDRPFEYFRRAPDGRSLIDFFDIPLCPETFSIDPVYLNAFPSSTIEEQTLINEMCVLADIESAERWQPSTHFFISPLRLLNQLHVFFVSPTNATLFHSDKYLSFLTVATTCLAYLQSCNNNSEAIKHKISPLISLIDTIIETHGSTMYKKETAKYIEKWIKLKNTLAAATVDPLFDCMPYYRSLSAHPHLSKGRKQELYRSHQQVQASEFLARKVGYWNEYYLKNPTYIDAQGLITKHTHCDFRKGTLFHLSEKEETILYEVTDVLHEPGFVCQICAPVSISGDVENPPMNIPIKLIFQGTIPNSLSKKRDLNAKGPGYKLWDEKGGPLFLDALKKVMVSFLEVFPQTTFAIEFTGHSLGGADAQNGAALLMELYSETVNQTYFQYFLPKIRSINIHTFNPAGIPLVTNARYQAAAKIAPLTIVRHHFVQMDAVSITGQVQLGAGSLDADSIEITECYNLGLSILGKHCLYAHACTDTIIPRKILDLREDEKDVEKYLYGIRHSWSDLSTHAHRIIKERPIINIAYNSLYIIGISTVKSHLTPIRFLSSPVNTYLDEQSKDARKEILDSTLSLFQNKQLLESA